MLMDAIKAKIGVIAPVEVFPGEDEINSLAENGYIILSGQTKIHTYKDVYKRQVLRHGHGIQG